MQDDHVTVPVTHEQDEAIPDKPVPLDQMTLEELREALEALQSKPFGWPKRGQAEGDLLRRIKAKEAAAERP